MTRAKMKQGPCSHAGVDVYVASRGTTVPLDDMSVRLNSFGIQTAEPGQVYAVISLTVTNHLDRRVAFDSQSDESVLNLGSQHYTEDASAEKIPGGSFAWRNRGIDPGRSQTANVVFHIPRRYVRRLSTLGNIVVAQFTDEGRRTPRKRIAILRTYS